MLDACRSGSAVEALGKLVAYRAGEAERKAQMLFARTLGTFLIAASTKQQYALESTDLGHGVLTYTLLAGLGEATVGPLVGKPADLDGDDVVMMRELVQYMEEHVPELTAQYQADKSRGTSAARPRSSSAASLPPQRRLDHQELADVSRVDPDDQLIVLHDWRRRPDPRGLSAHYHQL